MNSPLAEQELSPRRSRRLAASTPPPASLHVAAVADAEPPLPTLGPEGKRVFAFGSSGW